MLPSRLHYLQEGCEIVEVAKPMLGDLITIAQPLETAYVITVHDIESLHGNIIFHVLDIYAI